MPNYEYEKFMGETNFFEGLSENDIKVYKEINKKHLKF